MLLRRKTDIPGRQHREKNYYSGTLHLREQSGLKKSLKKSGDQRTVHGHTNKRKPSRERQHVIRVYPPPPHTEKSGVKAITRSQDQKIIKITGSRHCEQCQMTVGGSTVLGGGTRWGGGYPGLGTAVPSPADQWARSGTSIGSAPWHRSERYYRCYNLGRSNFSDLPKSPSDGAHVTSV